MYNLHRIKINNFLSFAETEYEFEKNKTVLVQGCNKTDEGAVSNGSGKSSLQEAIYFAITGNSLKNVSKAKLIRRGEARATVELTLQTHDKVLHIQRTIKERGTSELSVFLNNEETILSSISDKDRFILEQLGLSADDLKAVFIISKANYTPFFSLSDTVKKEFIGKFSGIEKIEDLKDKVKEEAKKYSDKCAKIESDINVKTSSIDMLKEFAATWKLEKAQDGRRLESLRVQEKELMKQVGAKNREQFFRTHSEIQKSRAEKLSTKVLEEEREKLQKLHKEIEKKLVISKKELTSVKSDSEVFEKELSSIRLKLSSGITCPKCQHKFIVDNKETVEQLEEQRETYQEALKETEDLIVDCKSAYEKEDKKYNTILSKILGMGKRVERVQKIQKELTQRSIDAMKEVQKEIDRKASISIELAEVKKKIAQCSSDNSENLRRNEEKTAQLEKEKIELQDILKENQDLSFIEERLLSLLKDFHTYLINGFLSNMERLTNEFLIQMKCDLRVLIDGYRELASGKLTQAVTCRVLRGAVDGELKEYSSGEQAKVEVAMILTLQELLSDSHVNLSFLSIDEVLDSLDSEGMLNLVNALSNVKKTIMLISHISIEDIKDTLIIEKINGTSKIRS
jgi:exonuclease SbcC